MINLDLAGKTFGPFELKYSWRDVIIYNLGIGAKISNLDYIYEKAKKGLKVYPSFASITTYQPLFELLNKLNIDLKTVLHGEEFIKSFSPIPPEGTIITYVKISGIYDKVKAALVVFDSESTDLTGKKLFETRMTIFCRGLGGWGGDSGPKSEVFEIPIDRDPDFTSEEKTLEEQAALYRLSGDYNPLHIDPDFAKAVGFPKPILHGLCTMGFAVRVFVDKVCGGDPGRFVSFGCRFSNVVYPGETLRILGWCMGKGIYHMKVSTQNYDVLSNVRGEVKE